ncbi:MAG: hypothetical protein KR126chlam5_00674 [Candidatus Anoxychlamydiales bacterium]|nr:hypothetical protein [Candidatus Anoxychlamydiales bacterium]
MLDTIAHIALRSIGFLAVFYSSYYGGEIVQGLITIGVPFYPAFILSLPITCLFIDYYM